MAFSFVPCSTTTKDRAEDIGEIVCFFKGKVFKRKEYSVLKKFHCQGAHMFNKPKVAPPVKGISLLIIDSMPKGL